MAHPAIRPLALFSIALLACTGIGAAAEPQDAPLPGKRGGRFGGRTATIAKHGGQGTEQAVKAGLAWLKAHQNADGRWNSESYGSHCPPDDACTGSGGRMYDVGVTGLALLAFLSDGHHPNRRTRYQRVTQLAVDWLVSEMETGEDDGLIGGRKTHAFMYNHAIATLALCEAYALSAREGLDGPAQRAVKFILRARNPYMAWRYEAPPNGENDTSITGWMIFALLAARDAGLEIEKSAFEGANAWLDRVTDRATARVGYTQRGEQPPRPVGRVAAFPPQTSESLTAVALLARIFTGADPRTTPILQRQADLLLAKLPRWSKDGSSNDFYYWYYGTLATFQLGGKYWKRWNTSLRTALLGNQRKDGHAAGSWDPIGPWGAEGGRVYATALCTMCLETYYRYARLIPRQPEAEPEELVEEEIIEEEIIEEEEIVEEIVEPELQPRRALRAVGGSPRTVGAVDAGLAWLASHQSDDGHWDSDGFSDRCSPDGNCPGPGGAMYDVGTTGLALLAFLGDGHHPGHASRYQITVKEGIAWLVAQMNTGADDGLIGGRLGHAFIYNHGIAALALCEAYALSRVENLRKPAQRALNFILRARNPYKAWRYEVPPNGENDTSVTVWMSSALVAGLSAGLEVDKQAFQGAIAWLDEVTDSATGRCGYTQRGERPARPAGMAGKYPTDASESLTAAALLMRFLCEPIAVPGARTDLLRELHADLLLTKLPRWSKDGSSNDYYYWYYGTMAMFQMGGKYWKSWNKAMKPALLGHQRTDGHARGSWDPIGPWGAEGGRIYTTAMATLCLEVYYRYARLAVEEETAEEEIIEEVPEEEIVEEEEIVTERAFEQAPISSWRKETPATRAGVSSTIWLALHQEADGHWDGDTFHHRCPLDDNCTGPGGALFDVGNTGLAVLAFLGDGHHPGRTTRYQKAVSAGVAWLVAQMQTGEDDGLIGGRKSHAFIYNHAIATLALCEAYALSKQEALRRPAQRAVNFILRARNPYKAWRYDVPPSGDNDTSVTVWMVSALTAARGAGLEVDSSAFQGATAWLDEVTDSSTGRCGYSRRGESPARPAGKTDQYPNSASESLTAAALLVRIYMGEKPSTNPMLVQHADLLLSKLPRWSKDGSTNDYYYWYYGTMAMYQMGGKYWKRWSAAMKPALLGHQAAEGHAKGSWDPIGPWGADGGRIYTTAMAMLCLEVFYRYERIMRADGDK